MTKRKGQVGKKKPVDGDEELRIARRMYIALRYHVHAQDLLSSRMAKQRIIIWVAVTATVLTAIAVVLYAGR